MKKYLINLIISIIVLLVAAVGISTTIIKVDDDVSTSTVNNTSSSYVLVNHNGGLLQAIAYHVLQPLIISRIDYYLAKNGLTDQINKKRPHLMGIQDIQLGAGVSLTSCGQKFQINVMEFDDSFKLVPILSGEYEVGSLPLRELNHAVLGMKVNSSRMLSVFNGGMKSKVYKIETTSVRSDESSQEEAFIILGEDHSKMQDVQSITCGDEIELDYLVRDSSGNIISDAQKITFNVGGNGQDNIPDIIIRSILGAPSNGTRIVICDSKALNSIINKQIPDRVIVEMHTKAVNYTKYNSNESK